jgi:hypothetical protein
MKKNQTLLELLVGIVVLGIGIQIVCVIVSKNYLYDAVGLWSGIGICCFSAIHMWRSIEDAVDLGEAGATKHVRLGYATRMVVALLVIGAVIYFRIGNYVTLLIGVFPLKLAAYLQPFTHKLFQKIQNVKKGG